jgi:small subunit ribosomal protein S10
MYLLRITLKSIKNQNNIKQNILKLKKINSFQNITIKGFFQIKNKTKLFTVLRSPHVNKKSREHFIYKNYNQKFDIKFKNFFQLLNCLIIIKKILTENFIIQTKIIKT